VRQALVSPPNYLAIGREAMASSCVRGGLGWILGKISLQKERSGIGTGCPGRWWCHHPWRGSKNVQIWHFRTWFSRCGGVGLTFGLDDLRALFQLNDSAILSVVTGRPRCDRARHACGHCQLRHLPLSDRRLPLCYRYLNTDSCKYCCLHTEMPHFTLALYVLY